MSARSIAVVAGALAALFVGLLFTARPLPDRVLGLVGGHPAAIEREGGLRITLRLPSGARAVHDVPGVTDEDGHDVVAIFRGGGVQFVRAVESPALAGVDVVRVSDCRELSPGDLGLSLDRWVSDEEPSKVHDDYYLCARDPSKIESWVAQAGGVLPPHTRVVYEHVLPMPEEKLRIDYWRTYLVEDRPALTGDHVADARVTVDPNTNRPTVSLTFDREGARRFGDLTAAMLGHKLAIVIGDQVRSAPIIQSAIRGGRAVITMGGSDMERQQQDARVLAATLRAGALPAGGEILDVTYVPPADQALFVWLARSLLALLAALLVGLVTWLAVAEPAGRAPGVTPLAGNARVWPRIAWTVGAIALMKLAGYISLPGINRVEAEHVMVAGRRVFDVSRVGIVGLGVMPLLTAFALVELAALIVPRWRKLRHSGPEGRRKLGRAVAVVAIAVAAAQAYFIAVYLESLSRGGAEVVTSPGLAFRAMTVGTLVAGTMVAAWLASIIGHRGIGNGYIVLLVAGYLEYAPWGAVAGTGAQAAFAMVALVCLVIVIVIALGTRLGSDREVHVPLPASGLAPISGAGGLAMVPAQLAALGLALPPALLAIFSSATNRAAVELVLVIATTFAWSAVFARPGLWRRVHAKAGLAPVDRRSWLRATIASAVILFVVDALALVSARAAPAAAALFDPIVLFLVVATMLDAADEVRDRRRGLIPVWPLHTPLVTDAVRHELAAAGIDHHLQASRLRALLWFFGPYVPIMVLVPPDRAPDAERILRGLFE